MLRFAFLVIVVVAIVALFTRAPAARRLMWVMLGLAVLYTVLKLTGLLETVAPALVGYLDTPRAVA